MPYPEMLLKPMREELTRVGVEELRSAEEVDRTLKESGTTLVYSCAASRPFMSNQKHVLICGWSMGLSCQACITGM